MYINYSIINYVILFFYFSFLNLSTLDLDNYDFIMIFCILKFCNKKLYFLLYFVPLRGFICILNAERETHCGANVRFDSTVVVFLSH